MKTYEKILISIILLLESIPVMFYNSDLKVDLFIFEDYSMYFSNFLHYLSYYIALAALFLILWQRISRIYLWFFIWRIIEIFGFFLFASQKTNLVTIPILLIFIIYENKKSR